MAASESKASQNVPLPEPKGLQTDHNTEKALTDFFTKLSETLDKFKNENAKPELSLPDKKFEAYSQAYQGFAQNNVSKSEGFTVTVDTNPKYDELTRKLIKEKRESDQCGQNNPTQGKY
jgi:hypothetical protein